MYTGGSVNYQIILKIISEVYKKLICYNVLSIVKRIAVKSI